MTDATKVWMPDTFFRNEKIGRFHKILQDNLYVRVFPDGDVLYSIRVSLTCACSMHLALFPLDKQTCNLDVASCKFVLLIIKNLSLVRDLKPFIPQFCYSFTRISFAFSCLMQMVGLPTICHTIGKELVLYRLPKALMSPFLEASSLIILQICAAMSKPQLVNVQISLEFDIDIYFFN